MARTRFAISPTSDQGPSSCLQRSAVGLDYYPSIQARCPPPVIDQDQWVADILVSWLNNQTDGFCHPNLKIRRRKQKSVSSLSSLKSSLGIFATDSITRGERLFAFPVMDTLFDIMPKSALTEMLCHCRLHDFDQFDTNSATTVLSEQGVETCAAKDIHQGEEFFFCSCMERNLLMLK